MSKRPHILELDITRGLAILAVLAIHSTSTPVTTLSSDSKLYIFYLLLNVFSKFAVPVFIFLSGLVLYYNYIQKDFNRTNITNFYRKRLTQILFPYITFSIIYYALVQIVYNGISVNDLWHTFFSYDFFHKLLIGKAYAHLYFIFIIIQFYIIFPFSIKLLQKKPNLSLHLVWLGFSIQWLFIFLDSFYLHSPYKDRIFLTYIGFFSFGAFTGIYYQNLKEWMYQTTKNGLGFVKITFLLWILSSGMNAYVYYFIYSEKKYLIADKIQELLWHVQSFAACILLLILSIWIYKKTPRYVAPFFTKLGAYSFAIYLIHPILLMFYRKIPLSGGSFMYHIWAMGSFITSLFLSWLIVWVIARLTSWHWIIFGPIPVKRKNQE